MMADWLIILPINTIPYNNIQIVNFVVCIFTNFVQENLSFFLEPY